MWAVAPGMSASHTSTLWAGFEKREPCLLNGTCNVCNSFRPIREEQRQLAGCLRRFASDLCSYVYS